MVQQYLQDNAVELIGSGGQGGSGGKSLGEPGENGADGISAPANF